MLWVVELINPHKQGFGEMSDKPGAKARGLPYKAGFSLLIRYAAPLMRIARHPWAYPFLLGVRKRLFQVIAGVETLEDTKQSASAKARHYLPMTAFHARPTSYLQRWRAWSYLCLVLSCSIADRRSAPAICASPVGLRGARHEQSEGAAPPSRRRGNGASIY